MENQEKIEAYLSGTLTGTVLEQFEAELLTNEALAMEVSIHRDMAALLVSSPKDELRANLANLSDDYIVAKEGFNWDKWLPLLALAALMIASIWYSYNLKTANYNVPEMVIPETTVAPSIVAPVQDSTTIQQKESVQKEQTAPKKPTPKKQPQFLPDTPKPQPKKPNPAIAAADLAPNPALESFINNQVRSGDFDFEVAKVNDLAIVDDEVVIKYQGQLTTNEDLSEYAFTAHLFSNKVADYENFSSIKSWNIGFTEFSETIMQFNIEEQMQLKPGRYYLYLEDADSGTIYNVQTFLVR